MALQLKKEPWYIWSIFNGKEINGNIYKNLSAPFDITIRIGVTNSANY